MTCDQVFCWIDRYHGMTMDDIRALEEQTKLELDEERANVSLMMSKLADSKHFWHPHQITVTICISNLKFLLHQMM